MPVQGPTNFFFKGPESKQILDLAGSLYPNLLFREKQPQEDIYEWVCQCSNKTLLKITGWVGFGQRASLPAPVLVAFTL